MERRIAAQADKDLRDTVELALDYDPRVRSTDIGVAALDGTVTLTGFVESYSEKLEAERVAKCVYGVKAVANEILVQSNLEKTDTGIATAAVNALAAHVEVPDDRIRVAVRKGWVYLEGTVDWQFQKDGAETAVRCLAGVSGVTNQIEVRPRVSATDVKSKIEQALTRHAALDARRINVTAEDGTVDLWGNVGALMQKDEAERAAWAALGVSRVRNHLAVVP